MLFNKDKLMKQQGKFAKVVKDMQTTNMMCHKCGIPSGLRSVTLYRDKKEKDKYVCSACREVL